MHSSGVPCGPVRTEVGALAGLVVELAEEAAARATPPDRAAAMVAPMTSCFTWVVFMVPASVSVARLSGCGARVGIRDCRSIDGPIQRNRPARQGWFGTFQRLFCGLPSLPC